MGRRPRSPSQKIRYMTCRAQRGAVVGPAWNPVRIEFRWQPSVEGLGAPYGSKFMAGTPVDGKAKIFDTVRAQFDGQRRPRALVLSRRPRANARHAAFSRRCYRRSTFNRQRLRGGLRGLRSGFDPALFRRLRCVYGLPPIASGEADANRPGLRCLGRTKRVLASGNRLKQATPKRRRDSASHSL